MPSIPQCMRVSYPPSFSYAAAAPAGPAGRTAHAPSHGGAAGTRPSSRGGRAVGTAVPSSGAARTASAPTHRSTLAGATDAGMHLPWACAAVPRRLWPECPPRSPALARRRASGTAERRHAAPTAQDAHEEHGAQHLAPCARDRHGSLDIRTNPFVLTHLAPGLALGVSRSKSHATVSPGAERLYLHGKRLESSRKKGYNGRHLQPFPPSVAATSRPVRDIEVPSHGGYLWPVPGLSQRRIPRLNSWGSRPPCRPCAPRFAISPPLTRWATWRPRRCCCKAKRARAKASWRRFCMPAGHAPVAPSWPSTVPPFQTRCWKPSCLASRRGPLARRAAPSPGCLSRLRGAACFWTKLMPCPGCSRASC